MVALGNVRNGKAGNPNLPTAQNMLEMRYDMRLEAEAQAYANTCPTSESATSGENFALVSPTTITPLQAVVQAVKSWWSVIWRNGINRRLVYTIFLERKPTSPRTFTQARQKSMAWAGSYRIGCGVRICGGSRVVVCRYSPKGNIYFQQVYIPGPVCGSCFSSCRDGLCAAPAA
ncbi:unnamed protein product [Strongylus vulgaris]|uniref:SCP domain-containing protein n=1 Tax=Strongylus vulgaris TaxID=40348 RepID=A0A3P7J5C5_STRVU|nr:unnamed protein product [Strongylus vulgaris]